MSFPIWLTPAGNLGIVPEAEYYQLALDAYDTSGGTLQFFKLSGTLPPGIQLTSTGTLQGIPISTSGPDLNQEYAFTVRVQNQNTRAITDRTFRLIITNIAPPIIIPRDEDLGIVFDGTLINKQLVAEEFILGNNLVWTIKSGTLPPGITLSSSGLLFGYLEQIPAVGPSSTPGWDKTEWDEVYQIQNTAGALGWDFPIGTTSERFNFTVEVSDGSRFDLSNYTVLVEPRRFYAADSTNLTVDLTNFTVDTGSRHVPIILTIQNDIPNSRQGSWFSLKIDAVDLDGDKLEYRIPSLTQGTFDEYTEFTGNTCVDAVVSNGNISIGLTDNTTLPALVQGDTIQVLVSTFIPELAQQTLVWYDADITNFSTIQLVGNVTINGNVGDYISQSVNSANASIANIAPTFGTLTVGGAIITGTLSFVGNLFSANIGNYITQSTSGGNAVVLATGTNTSTFTVRFISGTFVLNSGNIQVNGANVNAYPVATVSSLEYVNFAANVGDIITQSISGANATVVAAHNSYDSNISNPFVYNVRINSGNFITGSANLLINGSAVNSYPLNIACTTDVGVTYNTSGVFAIGVNDAILGVVTIDGISANSFVGTILTVGVAVSGSPSDQGSLLDGFATGFDNSKFDQGALSLPGTLSVNLDSGWITGFLPDQIANASTYEFEIQVRKKEYDFYVSEQLYTLTVLGDLYNQVNWLTPVNLATIENGAVSDLSVIAISTTNKNIFYSLTPSVLSSQLTYTRGVAGPYQNLPQGLALLPGGLISGRVSFQLFSVDMDYINISGTPTTFDIDLLTGAPSTTFDHTFEFTVTAETFDRTAASTRTFTLLVVERNIIPYENLYLKASLNSYQQLEYRQLLQDKSLFPPELLYRSTDPWFALTTNIKTLFLAGLSPSLASQYANALQANHYTKRMLFGDVKTAVARQKNTYDVIETNTGTAIGTYNILSNLFVPVDFNQGYATQIGLPNGTTVGSEHIKYEVVYAEIFDENTNELGQGPANSTELAGQIQNPYYNQFGNAYTIASPNAFSNMNSAILQHVNYANKGALPDWMTSVQQNGAQLGFVRAVVLAYTDPGASETIAWRLKQRNYNLNELNFVVDRYQLDNNLSANYDVTAAAFITSSETTFDRYPALTSTFRRIGSVNYAVNQSFELINERSITDINSRGGLDGITNYKDGDTLVFFRQEFPTGLNISDSYNQGWANSLNPWSDQPWDFDSNTVTTTDDLGWDASAYVAGYQEWIGSKVITSGQDTYSVINQRISVWRVNIDANDYVGLSLANVSSSVSSITANISGFGSVVRITNADNLFVGMPVKATGFGANSAVTDINGLDVTVFPGNISSIATTTTITFIPSPSINDVIYIRNGFTQGGVNIYYDPIVKTNNLVPNYSKIPQQIKTTSTVFDGNGTLFYDFRDAYSTPGQGSSYIKFPRLNVFDN